MSYLSVRSFYICSYDVLLSRFGTCVYSAVIPACEFEVYLLIRLYVLQMESLAKKFEEKYKAAAEVNGQLAVVDATHRDVQVVLDLEPKDMGMGCSI